MQLLSSRDFKSAKTSEGAYITIGTSGVVSISPGAVTKLKLKPQDHVIITQDKDGDYHIGKATPKLEADAFMVREYNHGKALQFNAKSLVVKMIADKDLAVSPEKKKSMRLDINFELGQHWSNVDLFPIVTD